MRFAFWAAVLLAAATVFGEPATQPAATQPYENSHLTMRNGRLVAVNDQDVKVKEFSWADYTNNECGECGEGEGESVNLGQDQNFYFTAEWSNEDHSTYYNFNLIQDQNGKISATLCVDGTNIEATADSYEEFCKKYPGGHEIMNQKFFDSMGVIDPMDQKYVDRAIEVHDKTNDEEWYAPEGMEEKFKDILERLNNDKWRVREEAASELFGTGIDGLVYIQRNISREKLSPEQNSRIDAFFSIYLNGFEVVDNYRK